MKSFISILLIIVAVFSIFMSSCRDDSFTARDLKITPEEATTGESILIEFQLENRWDQEITSTWTLVINGEIVQSKEIKAPAEASTRGYFQITAGEPGEYTADIRDAVSKKLTGTFSVTAL
ncbi:hypothetical protein ACFLYN_04530 [Chloroflexota bacterium]